MSQASIVKFTSGMPDIANNALKQPEGTLDWVGMSEIHQPLTIRDGGRASTVHARVQAFVDLVDPHAKGIHMSRLFLLLEEAAESEALTPAGLRALLEAMLESHDDISSSALVEFRFDHFIRRPALKSDNSGWASYPVLLRGRLVDGAVTIELGIDVTYSSTCPCSAALARQLIQRQFDADFAGRGQVSAEAVRAWLGTEEGIVATPHSQRSVAEILTRLAPEAEELPITHLVDLLEGALKTPVQAAVKREDEQEFARLNGSNLMFCEDAGRRLKAALNDEVEVEDFRVRVNHYESLHAHDAVSIVTKGIPGGFRAIC